MINEAGTEQLLDDLVTFVKRYVVLTNEHQARAIALWILHTHALEPADVTPYLAILSPVKRSGKSRLLEVLESVVANPWRAVQPTEAVLFRKIDQDGPTLLLDEVDALFRGSSERTEPLRAVLNAGNRRGSVVPRCVGKGTDVKVKDFATFCPKALTGIDNGTLPDTVADRAIAIRLERKTDAQVDRWLVRTAKQRGEPLRERAAKWADANVERLVDAEPAMPTELHDRAVDAWEPLVAIADCAGERWGRWARAAAVALAGDAAFEESDDVRLLADARRVFEDAHNLPSEDLARRLNSLDDAPWGAYRNGRGLDPRSLSRLLGRFRVRPKSVRITPDKTCKGYARADFADTWKRYLGGENPTHRHNALHDPDERGPATDTPPSLCRQDARLDPAADEDCVGVSAPAAHAHLAALEGAV